PGETGMSLWRGKLFLADSLSEEKTRGSMKMHDGIGWAGVFQKILGRPRWALSPFFYPYAKNEKGGGCLVWGNVTTVEVATELNDMEVSGEWLDVEFLMGGIPLAFLTLPVEGKRVTAQQLRVALTREMGFELCRAAVREGIIGAPLTGPLTLR